ncbi:MAG: enoyl-CoA hydratase/isomerase family protein [Alphaproteobacteria bacterium]|nr:enoyl-CoA hydratase/isomerase family protein [Alphaproteobacteria bacterium]
MPATYETLKIETHELGIMVVIMNRPQALNAMNTQMMTELRDVFQAFYVDPGQANCIILTGAGDRGFCSGADLKERDGMSEETWKRQHAIVEQFVRNLMICPIPVIAAVNGVAFGGGFEIALACDFIYMSESARLALPEVTRGIMPGAAGPQNLPRACGVRRAKEIVLTGLPVSAAEALQWNIANRVCAPDKLMEEALQTARTIASNAPIGVRQAKKSLDKATELDRHSGYAFELEAYGAVINTQDRLEGVRAFNEKRKPVFKGR